MSGTPEQYWALNELGWGCGSTARESVQNLCKEMNWLWDLWDSQNRPQYQTRGEFDRFIETDSVVLRAPGTGAVDFVNGMITGWRMPDGSLVPVTPEHLVKDSGDTLEES